MAKNSTQYVCQDCGDVSAKWSGRCDSCGAWNTLVEEAGNEQAPKGLGLKKGRSIEFVSLQGESDPPPRRVTGINEFDRVCGGGLVPGSALLVGGDPGIGKSTVLLQVVAALAAKYPVAYISGEEAIEQLRMRAERLGLSKANVQLAAATSVRDIVTSLGSGDAPEVVIIDSIQTMFVDSLESAPGTVSQVRASAQELIRLAKRRGFSVILVGHVTKDGQIAGPRVMEHMVDTVLYFEGERSHQFRILRAVKNRFGPTDEIGVFEMTDKGLMEVTNPSALFLSDHAGDINGAAVFAGIEGTRPMLVELQTLIAPSQLGTPRRAVVGWDSGRLAMVLAVLESRCGLAIGANDVYLNVAGGLRVSEPAADLAVAAALASSLSGIAVPPETVVFGEIGLSGEVRAVSHTDARLKEAEKLGFTSAIVPKSRGKGMGKKAQTTMNIREIEHLADLLTLFHAPAGAARMNTSGPEKSALMKETANG
ncbi:MAG: DNA repair protein RadA [Rhodospirillaceae bacterium]|nr:DNA repair protein RadA [Rhodospirillaceae bacterium]